MITKKNAQTINNTSLMFCYYRVFTSLLVQGDDLTPRMKSYLEPNLNPHLELDWVQNNSMWS